MKSTYDAVLHSLALRLALRLGSRGVAVSRWVFQEVANNIGIDSIPCPIDGFPLHISDIPRRANLVRNRIKQELVAERLPP